MIKDNIKITKQELYVLEELCKDRESQDRVLFFEIKKGDKLYAPYDVKNTRLTIHSYYNSKKQQNGTEFIMLKVFDLTDFNFN